MRQRRLKNEINVVPYIDVMLVLLVIFMVTAPMMTTASIDVPSVASAPQAPAEAIHVNIKANDLLSITIPGNKPEEKISRAELGSVIRAAQSKNAEQPVLIAADKGVKYEHVLSVMAELKALQVKRFGLLVQIKDK